MGLVVSMGGKPCDAMRLEDKGIDEWDGGLTTEVAGLGMGHVQCIQSRHYAALRKPGKGTKKQEGEGKNDFKNMDSSYFSRSAATARWRKTHAGRVSFVPPGSWLCVSARCPAQPVSVPGCIDYSCS